MAQQGGLPPRGCGCGDDGVMRCLQLRRTGSAANQPDSADARLVACKAVVVSAVQPQQGLVARREHLVRRAAGCGGFAVAQHIAVFTAGGHHHGAGHAACCRARLLHAHALAQRGAERNESLDARICQLGHLRCGRVGIGLPGQRLHRTRAKGMPRHADALHRHLGPTPCPAGLAASRFVQHKLHIGHAGDELLAVARAAQRLRTLAQDGNVAARMLQMRHGKARCRPGLAPHIGPRALPAQAMGVDDQAFGCTSGPAQQHGDLAAARCVRPAFVGHAGALGLRLLGHDAR